MRSAVARITNIPVKRGPISSDGRTFTVQGTGRNNESLNAFILHQAAPSFQPVSQRAQGIKVATSGFKTISMVTTMPLIEKGLSQNSETKQPISATLYRLLDESGKDIPASDAKKEVIFTPASDKRGIYPTTQGVIRSTYQTTLFCHN